MARKPVQAAASERRELTAHMRSALVVFHLGVLGKHMTTKEIAALVGVSERGSLYILHRISATDVPLAYVRGKWFMLKDGEDVENR